MTNKRPVKVPALVAICALIIAGFTVPPTSATALSTTSNSFGVASELNVKLAKAAVKKKKLKKKYKTIKSIDPMGIETVFTVMASQSSPTWGLDRVDGKLDGQFTYASDGKDVLIYIVDTGVDSKHPDLFGRVLDGFDSFGENLDQVDCHGHGTHVAGISSGTNFGVAKLSKIVPVRVLDCNGRGNTTTLTKGIDWILENKTENLSIVNMSLGGPIDPEVNSSVERLVSAGFVVVASAGNSNSDACSFSPASAVGVLAVGATDRDDSIAAFSNKGSCVDIFAPGVQIVSANTKDYNLSLNRSGTSQAAPFVSGAIATYISNKSVNSNLTVESYLKSLTPDSIVVVEPAPTNSPNVKFEPSVNISELEPGSVFGILRWTTVSNSSGYKVYRTSPDRPSWRVYGDFPSNLVVEMLVVTDLNKSARYKVVAIVDGREVEIGQVRHKPK